MPASKSSARLRLSSAFVATVLCLVVSAAVMAASIEYVYRSGATLYFGDAEAHLNIARRIIDSRTPGWYQIGTVWLPLPHLLMLPLVRRDDLWTTGLAGAYTAGACMTLAAVFLFAALRRLFLSIPAAIAGTAVFLLNPNALYLGSIPMTEPVFFATLFALLYFTVRFHKTQGWGALVGASIAAFLGTMTRYEGWVLLPFVTLFILFAGPRRKFPKRLAAAFVFALLASTGPALWLLHNRWYFGDALYFYRGPYSALTIQGKTLYPGIGDWRMATHYFLAAGQLVAGTPGLIVGAAGLLFAILRRAFWPVLLLAIPAAFYVLSIHSSGTPIFVPTLWPFTWYNTRYAVALVPLVALGVAAIASINKPVAAVVTLIAFAPFLLHPTERPVTWKESDVNSKTRRQWTDSAARYLRANAAPHDTILTTFGDMTGIFRSAGIPLRNTITANNVIEWAEVTTHPDMFLFEDWAVINSGDNMQHTLDRLRLHGPRYQLEQWIMVKGAPVVEIYNRAPNALPDVPMPGTAIEDNENPLP